MPTTITSAGITFNDATSLTSANIGTAQLVNGSVTAAKLGTTEQRQIAKAWVNFNGVELYGAAVAPSTFSISCNSGSTTGTWTITTGWGSGLIGVIYKFTQINGVTGATFGGVDVSTLGIQILSIVGNVATFRFLSGTTTSAQSVTGTGSSASGFSYASTGIRSSYNVSSVTKNATGDYTVNFASALADGNYSSLVTGYIAGSPIITGQIVNTLQSSLRVLFYTSPSNSADANPISVAVFGN